MDKNTHNISAIRNFCILAHIDHGKSTLADRFLEITGTVEKRRMRDQFLDMHPLEREKGITIKMQPVRMSYTLYPDEPYTLNLIDTPGHVDFNYEVSRALAAVEGALLLVDATQGVQAQTLANLALAEREKLEIIPAVNKIDLPSAEVEKTKQEVAELLGIGAEGVLAISAKTGAGVEELLQKIVEKIPPPLEIPGGALRALVFDSLFDPYQGIIAYIRIFDGSVRKGDTVRFLASQADCEVLETGVFSPARSAIEKIGPGEIGYIATGIKEPEKVRVGDTITHKPYKTDKTHVEPLRGYLEPAPMVYASVFPENQDQYDALREAFRKLRLNDAALSFVPEESPSLGRGFRAGFLGMLHMEIAAERIRREYDLALIFTNPSVAFRVKTRCRGVSGKMIEVYSASKLPQPQEIEIIEEPWALVEIISPPSFLGIIQSLIHENGGIMKDTLNLGKERLRVSFEAPLREIITDFYDKLKSVSQGYASMAYEFIGFRPGDLVRLNILVAGETVDAFSEIIPRDEVYMIGRTKLLKLKEFLPRELFAIALQAEVEGRILARETIPAMKKDVTGYLYGGDRTRKMKLWKKQQRGKKRLRASAQVEIPAEVFLKMLKK